MSSAPRAADFPLQALRPSQACAPHLAAVFAGASLGLLLAQAILSGSTLAAALESGAAIPQFLRELALSLPRPSEATTTALTLLLCLLGALLGRRLPLSARRRPAKWPAADAPLQGWVRSGDVVELQFASGTWLLVRAQVNDRQWRDVQRLLVWSRRMACGDAA